MDLQRIVGRSPRHAGCQQLRHAGLEVAAPSGVFLAGCKIGELTRDHDLDRHHDDLVGDAREIVDRLAELLPVQRIAQAEIHRRLRDTNGAGRCLDARRLERDHELLEALALFAAQQVGVRHLEPVKADLVLLHAAIAEHADLATCHALGREGVGVGATRLGRKQHRQPLVARRIRVRPYQERHHVGARRMRDPGLVARDLPDVTLAHCTRTQAAKVRARIGFREHRRRKHLARGDLRQPVLLLLGRAAAKDQLGRDFRARSKRADTDIAAREFFRHDAHRGLAEPGATELLRDRQPEHAELAHLLNDRQRNELVLEVPLMCVRRHAVADELAELLADEVHLLVQGHVSKCDRGGVGLDQLRQAPAHGRAGAFLDQVIDRARSEPRDIRGRHAQVRHADHFALAHRDATDNLRAVFAEPGEEQQRLHLAKLVRRGKPFGPALHLAQRLDIGRQPRKPVSLVLRIVHAAGLGNGFAHAGLGNDLNLFGRDDGLANKRKDLLGSHCHGDAF